jgi:hypothetical protein
MTGTTGRDAYRIYGEAGTLSLLRFFRRDLALEVGAFQRKVTDEVPGDPFGKTSEGYVRGGLVGGRYYPDLGGPVRPYVAASLGGFDVPEGGGLRLGTVSGAGVDLFIGRRATFSIQGTVSVISGQATQVETRVGLGWSFGGRGGTRDAGEEGGRP